MVMFNHNIDGQLYVEFLQQHHKEALFNLIDRQVKCDWHSGTAWFRTKTRTAEHPVKRSIGNITIWYRKPCGR